MGLGQIINELFNPIDLLTKYSRLKKHKEFNDIFQTWSIYIVDKPILSKADINNGNEVMDEIKRDVEALNKNNGITPWVTRKDNDLVMPIFSSLKNAQLFAQNYVREKNEIYSFPMVSISGENFLKLDFENVKVILNYKTDYVTGINRMIDNIKKLAQQGDAPETGSSE